MSAHGGPSVNYHNNKKSHLVIIDPDNSMVAGKTTISSVVDTVAIPGKTINFTATVISVTSSKMKVRLTGQGLPAAVRATVAPPDSGFLTITLINPVETPPLPPPPAVDQLPVDYVDDNT